jgi:hypothetical protein
MPLWENFDEYVKRKADKLLFTKLLAAEQGILAVKTCWGVRIKMAKLFSQTIDVCICGTN